MPQLPLPQRIVVAGILLASLFQQPVLTGYLSGYDQVPTDATVAYRQSLGQIPDDLSEFDALVAVLDCSQIGSTGMLYTDVGPLRVIAFDCAGSEDGGHQWMTDGNYVAELDWYSRQAHPELMGAWAVLAFD